MKIEIIKFLILKMQKLYVHALSKQDLRRKLVRNETIVGIEYNAFNPDGYTTYHIVNNLEHDAVLAICSHDEPNSPFVWGIYQHEKGFIK